MNHLAFRLILPKGNILTQSGRVAGELLFRPYFLRISLPATILRSAIWSFFLSISLLPWPACSVLAASVP
jgi:hypothetical protein